MIYLDYAATSYIKEECVYQEMDRLFRTMSVNAGRGTYPASRQAQKLIDETRAQIASQTGWYDPSDVYFTASATQAVQYSTARAILGAGGYCVFIAV